MKITKQLNYSFSVKDIENLIIAEIIKKEKLSLNDKDKIIISPIIKNDITNDYERFPTPFLDSIEVKVKMN